MTREIALNQLAELKTTALGVAISKIDNSETQLSVLKTIADEDSEILGEELSTLITRTDASTLRRRILPEIDGDITGWDEDLPDSLIEELTEDYPDFFYLEANDDPFGSDDEDPFGEEPAAAPVNNNKMATYSFLRGNLPAIQFSSNDEGIFVSTGIKLLLDAKTRGEEVPAWATHASEEAIKITLTAEFQRQQQETTASKVESMTKPQTAGC